MSEWLMPEDCNEDVQGADLAFDLQSVLTKGIFNRYKSFKELRSRLLSPIF